MIRKVDHMVITTQRVEECLEFYKKLGFTPKKSIGRYELYAGDFKINVHVKGSELTPHAQNVTMGSADFCFEISGDIEKYKAKLESLGILIELGVVFRTGVNGEMKSIYVRDLDGNLLEFSQYPLVRE